jgi:transglutaminase superfamily protein
LFLTRLASFARLPATEKRLALRAIALLAAARVALRILPFDRARSLIAVAPRLAARAGDDLPRSAVPGGDELPRAVRRAVIRASRSLPGSSCLAQSLVAERLLRAGGRAARLSIGVAAPGDAATMRIGLDAHAWVESGGVVVTGDDPHDRYQVLATFGSE